MSEKSIVMLFDASKGEFVKETFYCLPPKKALIAAIMQYRGNANTWEYPTDLDGVYKSHIIKGRLLYDLTENLVLYAQRV